MSDHDSIDSPPAGAAGWRDVWERRLHYPESRGSVGFVRRILRRFLGADLALQRDFNIAILDLVEGLRSDIHAIRDEVRREQARQDEKLTAGIQRNDALVTVLDQKIEGALSRIRDLATPVLTGEHPAFREDYLYRRFEDSARGSKDETRETMRDLVELLRDHAPVVDVGCGRGEMLELCRQAGIEARGIDVNERSISELASEGFEVSVGAIPDGLASIGAGTVGAVYASHVVEHLQTSPLVSLLAESRRILRKGGLLVIETPNAQSVMMSGSEFWKDPSHVAPRHPASLIILGRELGFAVHELRTIHPFDEALKLRLDGDHSDELHRFVDRLNEILFGDQDLRLILKSEE